MSESQTNNHAKKSLSLVDILITIALSFGAIYLGFHHGESTETALQLASRWTARISVGFYVLFFILSHETENRAVFANAILQQCLLAHIIHAFVFISYFVYTKQFPSPLLITAGLPAYAALMYLAKTRIPVGTLPALRIGMIYYIWLIFTLTYLLRLPESETLTTGIVGIAIMLSALLVRKLRMGSIQKTT